MKRPPAFYQVEPGAFVMSEGQIYRIKAVLSGTKVLAVNLQDRMSKTLDIDALTALDDRNPADDETPRPDIASYSTEAWAEAQRRFQIIQPLLDDSSDSSRITLAMKRYKVSRPSIYRWIKAFQQGGHVSSLVPGEKGRKEGQRQLTKDQEAVITGAIEDVYLNKQRHSSADVVREVYRRCREAQIVPPSPGTIRVRVGAVEIPMAMRARGYRDQARNRFAPIRSQFPGGNHPLDVVQIDHTPLDIICVDEKYRIPLGRPFLTLATDVYSRMVVGFYLSFNDPASMSISLCIAHGMLPKREYLARLKVEGDWPVWGKPRSIHTDNGKDFRSDMLKRACQEYNIDMQFRPVGTPHMGGHIERHLQTVLRETHKLPGTTFSNPQQRKGYDSAKHAAISLLELERLLATYIVKIYHKTIHSATGLPPEMQWNIGLSGDETTRGIGPIDPPHDPHRLYIDFLPFEMRSVQRYGIEYDVVHYYSPILDRYINVADPKNKKKKQRFLVRRDPRDISKVYFLDPATKHYTPIPYNQKGNPPISKWELLAVRKYLKEKGQTYVDERTIFAAREEMRKLTDESVRQTKAVRRQTAKQVEQSVEKLTGLHPIPEAPRQLAKRTARPGAPATAANDPFAQPLTRFEDIEVRP